MLTPGREAAILYLMRVSSKNKPNAVVVPSGYYQILALTSFELVLEPRSPDLLDVFDWLNIQPSGMYLVYGTHPSNLTVEPLND